MTSIRNFSKKIKSGFTLIELTITIAILGLTLTLTGGILISVVKSFQKQSELQKIERNGDIALRTIEEKIRKAKNVELLTDAPFTGTSPGIRIFGTDSTFNEVIGVGGSDNCRTGAGGPNNNLFVYRESPPSQPLIDSVSLDSISDEYKITNDATNGVDITEIAFIVSPGNPIQVNATIKVSSSACQPPGGGIIKSFSTFVTARGSY